MESVTAKKLKLCGCMTKIQLNRSGSTDLFTPQQLNATMDHPNGFESKSTWLFAASRRLITTSILLQAAYGKDECNIIYRYYYLTNSYNLHRNKHMSTVNCQLFKFLGYMMQEMDFQRKTTAIFCIHCHFHLKV
jgi:hypothetical protein